MYIYKYICTAGCPKKAVLNFQILLGFGEDHRFLLFSHCIDLPKSHPIKTVIEVFRYLLNIYKWVIFLSIISIFKMIKFSHSSSSLLSSAPQFLTWLHCRFLSQTKYLAKHFKPLDFLFRLLYSFYYRVANLCKKNNIRQNDFP